MNTHLDRIDEIIELREALSGETDRGCALHAASYLDHELSKMIKCYFIKDSNVARELLEGTGGLSSFSSRIAISYALGYVSDHARHDLNLIRKIRNDFGHNPQKIGFDHEPIANRCRELHYRWDPLDRPPRRFFENSVFAVAALIHGAVMAAKKPDPPIDIVVDEEMRKRVIQTGELLMEAIPKADSE